MPEKSNSIGACYLGSGRCRFRVWAPFAEKVDLKIVAPQDRLVPMDRDGKGYFSCLVEGVEPGSRYLYRLNQTLERPDPASNFQPQGVHGPSQLIATDFRWTDNGWAGIPLEKQIFYELHVGTYTPEGTFDAIIRFLDDLLDLGITTIELMPVAQFPGDRNWGYDGVYPFAAQDSYGGPASFMRLVDACHKRGLAVALDVVYNHLGPEGNYLADFGPYFTDRYHTPWGKAVNFDGPESDEVRRFFIENALQWVTEFHVDVLRLDAVHAIYDHSARPFLAELAAAVHQRAAELNRRLYVIAESDLNDARIIRSNERGGYGLDSQWSDDFHHALHTLLTGEQTGYYQDFGSISKLVRAYKNGYAYAGQYSLHRRRRHGNSTALCAAKQFIVCAQNHDQIGNRMLGERLSKIVPFAALKLAAGIVLLSPYVPLLFMGEEYGETAPFQYFVSHLDPQLIEAVRQGRKEEFASFAWLGEAPDPLDKAAFLSAKLDHSLVYGASHQTLLKFYKELIRLRGVLSPLANLNNENLEVLGYESSRTLYVRRWVDDEELVMVFNLSDKLATALIPLPVGRWHKLLDSADAEWLGGGNLMREDLSSDGQASINLNSWEFVLFYRLGKV